MKRTDVNAGKGEVTLSDDERRDALGIRSDRLDAHPFFKTLPPDLTARFRDRARNVSLQAGQSLTLHGGGNPLYLATEASKPLLVDLYHAETGKSGEALGKNVELESLHEKTWFEGTTGRRMKAGLHAVSSSKQDAIRIDPLRNFYSGTDSRAGGISRSDLAMLMRRGGKRFSDLMGLTNEDIKVLDGFKPATVTEVDTATWNEFTRLQGAESSIIRANQAFAPDLMDRRRPGPHAYFVDAEGSFYVRDQVGTGRIDLTELEKRKVSPVAIIGNPETRDRARISAFEYTGMEPRAKAPAVLVTPRDAQVVAVPIGDNLDLMGYLVDEIGTKSANTYEHYVQEAIRLEAEKPLLERWANRWTTWRGRNT